MSHPSTHRLWPVLSALVLLLAGALVLEEVAERRNEAPIVIRVGNDGEDDGEAGEDSGGAAPVVSGAPLSPDHARAREAARRGGHAAAARWFRAVIEAHPENAGVRAELGFWLLVAGDPAAAAVELESAVGLGAREAAPWFNLGLARRRTGDLTGAEAAFRAAVAFRGTHTPSQVALASLLRQQRRFDEALAVLASATRAGSNDEVARALVAQGRVLLAKGDRRGAVSSFTRAVERAPAAVGVRVSIARAHLAGGDPEDHARALAVARQAATLAPDVAEVAVVLARALEATGDDGGAREAYARAVRLEPDDRLARRRLLRLELEARDFVSARANAERLLADAPGEPEHHFLAGLAAAREGRRDEGRSHYREAIQRAGGTYPEAYFNLGLLERGEGRLDAAIEAYETAVAQRPGYLAALNNLGLALLAEERTKEAEQAFQRALAVDDRYAPAWLNLGRLHLGSRRFDLAAAAFESALRARPDYPEALLNLGTTYSRAGRKREAITTYRRLVALNPRYAAAWFNMGLALEAEEQLAEARAAFARVLEIDAAHHGALEHLAALELSAGALTEASLHYQELLDLAPADRRARLAVAEVHRRLGEPERCEREARALLATAPGDARARALMARCGSRAGKP